LFRGDGTFRKKGGRFDQDLDAQAIYRKGLQGAERKSLLDEQKEVLLGGKEEIDN